MSWNRQISCSHKAVIGCVLTATAACCSCSDNRPIAPTYDVYVDGGCMSGCGSRWQSYCWKCRDYWSASSIHSNFQQSENYSNHLFETAAPFTPPAEPESSIAQTMQPTHAHPNGLGASWWANPRMSTSSTSSYNQSGGMLDVTNRPRHTHDTNPRRERPRPRMRQRPIAPLGTREDVENENYVSPLGEMFTRAYGRYRIAEETRQQAFQADEFRNDENSRPNPLRSRAANHTDNFANQQVLVEQANYNMDPQYGRPPYPQWIQNAHTEFDRRRMGLVTPEQAMVEDARLFETLQMNELRQREEALQLTMNAIGRVQPHMPQTTQPIPPPRTRTLNLDDQPRPPARASEDMVVNIACTVCFEHPINVVLLPCWHACMCNWCADLCIPTRRNSPYARPPTDYTGKCPKCRVIVKERREIFLG